MTTQALQQAKEAVVRAKKLHCWDHVPHALHVELDTIFKALATVSDAPLSRLPPLPAPAGTMQMNWGTPYAKDIDGYTADQMRGYAIDATFVGQPAQPISSDAQPVAWVRRHPDGALTAEFLEDAVIEPVRKKSGAWVPLYASPAPDVRPSVPLLTLKEMDDLRFAWDRLHALRENHACQVLIPILNKLEPVSKDVRPSVQGVSEQARYLDEIDAARAGDQFVRERVEAIGNGAAKEIIYPEESLSGQSPRIKCVGLFNHNDDLMAAYLLTRDSHNRTLLTKVCALASQRAAPSADPLQALADEAQDLDMGYGPSACPTCGQSADARLQKIAGLAQQGMCHGLLADDYCRQIAEIADPAGQAAPSVSANAKGAELPPLPEPEGTIHSDGYWIARKNPYRGKFGEVYSADMMREYGLTAIAQAAPAVPELSDGEIVKVLASLGIDADKSVYDWNPVLQVRTTVPGIRKIVAAYVAAAPTPPAAPKEST